MRIRRYIKIDGRRLKVLSVLRIFTVCQKHNFPPISYISILTVDGQFTLPYYSISL
jgi:hypothetical protein